MFKLDQNERLIEVRWSHGFPGHKDSNAGTWYFAAKNSVLNVDSALRDAIADHLSQNKVKVNFNWGDAITELSGNDWAKYGLRLLTMPVAVAITILVDHDEAFALPDN